MGIFTIIITLVLGLCIGSFLNVVIYRLPRGESLARPSSHCPKCEHHIAIYDNVPILSYIILRGRCRHCGEKISPRYPLVELANTLLYFLALCLYTPYIFSRNGVDYLSLVTSCLAFSTMLAIFMCDLDNMEIPDELQMTLLVIALVSIIGIPNASDRVYGFLVGGGFFLIFSFLFYLIRHKQGLGFGDVKLMAVLGLFLGLGGTILTIILSCMLSAIILSLITIFKKGGRDREFPFATFIVPCAIFCMAFGSYIVEWYLSLF